MSLTKKTGTILTGILITYATLVATHKGEFWPFSIYPMFSKAGNPWTRSIVRDVTNEARPIVKDTQTKENLYGETFVLNTINVHQNDLSNFMSKNQEWPPSKKKAVRSYFGDILDKRSLVIYKVRGEMVDGDVEVSYQPFIYLKPDTTIILNHD